MENLQRNELRIELAGETRTLRASFTAIRAIETALGKSLVKIVDDLSLRGDISVTDTAVIIFHGLKGYDDTRLTIDQVGEAIVGEPFRDMAAAAAHFLSIALKGAPGVGKPEEAKS
ncbi:GTA-gp10 family protein [Methylorubrum sp. SB2]|uniref:GTA-gp10 family protein n=1 Tax=Methylorubrum subtropicum TaxID=3138812 RepID=UPI00313EB9D0